MTSPENTGVPALKSAASENSLAPRLFQLPPLHYFLHANVGFRLFLSCAPLFSGRVHTDQLIIGNKEQAKPIMDWACWQWRGQGPLTFTFSAVLKRFPAVHLGRVTR